MAGVPLSSYMYYQSTASLSVSGTTCSIFLKREILRLGVEGRVTRNIYISSPSPHLHSLTGQGGASNVKEKLQ